MKNWATRHVHENWMNRVSTNTELSNGIEDFGLVWFDCDNWLHSRDLDTGRLPGTGILFFSVLNKIKAGDWSDEVQEEIKQAYKECKITPQAENNEIDKDDANSLKKS